MREIDFDPETMTRATPEDVERMFERLWGSGITIYFLATRNPGFEYLDLTQELSWDMVSTSDLPEIH